MDKRMMIAGVLGAILATALLSALVVKRKR